MIEKPKGIESFCSVCNQSARMEVVKVDKESAVKWVKCPFCKGIFPHAEETQKKSKDPAKARGPKEETNNPQKTIPTEQKVKGI